MYTKPDKNTLLTCTLTIAPFCSRTRLATAFTGAGPSIANLFIVNHFETKVTDIKWTVFVANSIKK